MRCQADNDNSHLLHELLWATVVMAFLSTMPAEARQITDMMGRTLAVPDKIERPFGAAPPLTALIYAIDPDLVQALNMPFSPKSGRFLDPRVRALPVVGSAMGHGRQVNPETLLTLKPDLAIAWQNSFSDLPPESIEAPFNKAGIPVIYVKLDTLADWPPAFEFVGRLLGREARGHELAQYIRSAMTKVATLVAPIPSVQRPKVYYAESPDGLATDCDTSFHAEPIALAGGDNVYHCRLRTMVGMERVDMERVTLWDPQVIVVQDAHFLSTATNDPRWQRIAAFRSGRILDVPRLPMNWLDRPPSFMRALGIQWLAQALYPNRIDLDLRAETRHFFRLFFQVELTDADLEVVLGNQTH